MIHEINKLVLEYLVINGFRAVAEQFVQEAQLPQLLEADLDDVSRRAAIAQHVLDGNVSAAIDSLNELDLFFLEENFAVYFSLLELRLLEMVRPGLGSAEQCGPVLECAQQLVKLVENDKYYMKRVEAVLVLVCYPLESLPDEYHELISVTRRTTVAMHLNQTLMQYRGLESQSKLERAVKLSAWTRAGGKLEV